jgi:replication-associated recombination protein RarA
MSTHISVVPEGLEWKQAYLAAVLEKDRTRVVGLIHDARSKFATRLDELEAESYSHDEIEAIQDADYLLQALQSSLSYRNDLRN